MSMAWDSDKATRVDLWTLGGGMKATLRIALTIAVLAGSAFAQKKPVSGYMRTPASCTLRRLKV